MSEVLKDYNLVDIHFHTEDSHDTDSSKYDYKKINKVLKDNNVKLIVKTDHNKLGISTYKKMSQEMQDVKILPGIELNIEASNKYVHWIIILNDKDLDEENEELVDKFLLDNVDMETNSLSHKKFIDFMFKNKIECLCIPHLDKHAGYIKNCNSEDLLKLIDLLVNGIVIGFESKSYATYFEEAIDKTNKFINSQIASEESISDDTITYKEFIESMEDIRKASQFSIVFGSDTHLVRSSTNGSHLNNIDDYPTLVNKLFYMKALTTFEGLKLALLDQTSRIQKYTNISEIAKSSSNVIDKIKFNQNGIEVELDLGDGLNSIIGLRGSGKSYLVNALVDNIGQYKSGIVEKNRDFKIKFCDEEEWFLPSEVRDRIDIIGQKNSNSSGGKNLYSMLTDSPYNTEELVKIIRSYGQGEKREEKVDLKSLVNEFFEYYIRIFEICEEKCESEALNTWYNEQIRNDNQQIIDLISEAISVNTKAISKLSQRFNDLSDIEKYIEKIEKFQFTQAEQDKIKRHNLPDFNVSTLEALKKQIEYINTINNNDLLRGKKINEVLNKANTKSKDLLNVKNQEMNAKSVMFERNIRNIVKLNKSILARKNEGIKDNFVTETWNLDENLKVELLNKLPIFSDDNKDFTKKINSKGIEPLFNLEIFNFQSYNYEKIEPIIKNIRSGTPINETFEVLDYEESIMVSRNNEEVQDIRQLSPGERTNIVLDIILSENVFNPIILDQPEDDLDNSTVYNLLVCKLRKLKFKRQIIIVSHNANIVINSDSDRVIYCSREEALFNYRALRFESNDMVSFIKKHENVTINTLELCSEILEGGKDALALRIRKVGHKNIFIGDK